MYIINRVKHEAYNEALRSADKYATEVCTDLYDFPGRAKDRPIFIMLMAMSYDMTYSTEI